MQITYIQEIFLNFVLRHGHMIKLNKQKKRLSTLENLDWKNILKIVQKW